MKVKVRKKPVRAAERAEKKSDNTCGYEDIRRYIMSEFNKFKETHPIGLKAVPHDYIEAEKKRYVDFIGELMSSLMNQD